MSEDLSWDQARIFLESRLHPLGLEIHPQAWEQLVFYLKALAQKAPQLKLTAVKSRKERIQTQVLESLILAAHLPSQGLAADLGTGAGIPGLVVKIVRPDIHLVLLEAFPPRVTFMNQIIQTLRLSGVKALAIHLGKDPWPGPFDLVFARGYGSVVKFTQHAARCLRPEGQAFYLWRKEREPWGREKPALRLKGEKTFPNVVSPLLIWEKH